MIIDDKIEFSLITKKRGFMEYYTHETNIKRENKERKRERDGNTMAQGMGSTLNISNLDLDGIRLKVKRHVT